MIVASGELRRLYHGGHPGYRLGAVIVPHPTKHVDGCPVCAAAADENHRPDHVFASAERLYAKFYASKYGLGWVYEVVPVGEMEPSTADPFDSFSAPAFRVVRVVDRAVLLTMTERRRLWRLWGEEDRRRGRPARSISQRWATERMLGIRR